MRHTVVRWSLAAHGTIHVAETFLNVYEKAYYSAGLSLFSSIIMLLGAFIGNPKNITSQRCL